MKHRQTRRKGRHTKHRETRRKQRGGAADSAKDWFDAVAAFQKEKNITDDYPLTSLVDPTLSLPTIRPEAADKENFSVTGVPVNGKEPTFTRFDIRMISVILEQILGPVLRGGYDTPAKFDIFMKQIRDSSDEDDPKKETINFLNEIEVSLQNKAADVSSNISVFNRNGQTLYIWYLAMNPASLPQEVIETPLPSALPNDYVNIIDKLTQVATTQGAPAVLTV
jgi:hypothetical protein